MECELEVIGLDTGIFSLQLLHRLYYFVNSYNCYHRAYSVKNSPDYVATFYDLKLSIVLPFMKLC